MIVHSYATDGFFPFAKTLLLSFKKHHGESIPFVFHTKDLNSKQLAELHECYSNLTTHNSKTDWKWLKEQTSYTQAQLKQGKEQVEQQGNKYLSQQFYYWKHYISIYSRYRDALQEMIENTEEGEHILHLDADLYINRPIDEIFNLIKLADVSLLLRPNYSPEWRKTYGCIMGFTVNEKSKKFLARVRAHINQPHFLDIPKGYGQTVFWRAYTELSKTEASNVKFAAIPKGWIYKGFNNKSLILSANNGLKKMVTMKRYEQLLANKPVADVERNSQAEVKRRIKRERKIQAKEAREKPVARVRRKRVPRKQNAMITQAKRNSAIKRRGRRKQ